MCRGKVLPTGKRKSLFADRLLATYGFYDYGTIDWHLAGVDWGRASKKVVHVRIGNRYSGRTAA